MGTDPSLSGTLMVGVLERSVGVSCVHSSRLSSLDGRRVEVSFESSFMFPATSDAGHGIPCNTMELNY